jgi:hypothetical protein
MRIDASLAVSLQVELFDRSMVAVIMNGRSTFKRRPFGHKPLKIGEKIPAIEKTHTHWELNPLDIRSEFPTSNGRRGHLS